MPHLIGVRKFFKQMECSVTTASSKLKVENSSFFSSPKLNQIFVQCLSALLEIALLVSAPLGKCTQQALHHLRIHY